MSGRHADTPGGRSPDGLKFAPALPIARAWTDPAHGRATVEQDRGHDMSSNIKGVGETLAQVSDIASKARKADGVGSSQPSSGVETIRPSDEVSFSEGASKLRELEGSLRSVPVVDTERVDAVKKAVDEGTYEVNHARIADKMMKFEGLLDEVGPKKT